MLEGRTSYERILAKGRMIATDHLPPKNGWRMQSLNPEQIQREFLRQAADTKLQLVSILNAIHFILIAICVLIGVIIWRHLVRNSIPEVDSDFLPLTS